MREEGRVVTKKRICIALNFSPKQTFYPKILTKMRVHQAMMSA